MKCRLWTHIIILSLYCLRHSRGLIAASLTTKCSTATIINSSNTAFLAHFHGHYTPYKVHGRSLFLISRSRVFSKVEFENCCQQAFARTWRSIKLINTHGLFWWHAKSTWSDSCNLNSIVSYHFQPHDIMGIQPCRQANFKYTSSFEVNLGFIG
jgi:hypothetical protein